MTGQHLRSRTPPQRELERTQGRLRPPMPHPRSALEARRTGWPRQVPHYRRRRPLATECRRRCSWCPMRAPSSVGPSWWRRRTSLRPRSALFFDSPLLLIPIATAPMASTMTTAAAAPSGNSRVRRVRAGRANGTTSAAAPAVGVTSAAPASGAAAAERAASSRAATSAGIGIGGRARSVACRSRIAARSAAHWAQSATCARTSAACADPADSSESTSSASVSWSGCGVLTGGPLGAGSSVVRRAHPLAGSLVFRAGVQAAEPT